MLYGINRQADWSRPLGFCYQNWGVDAGFLEQYLEKLPQGFQIGFGKVNNLINRPFRQLKNAKVHLSLEFKAYANL